MGSTDYLARGEWGGHSLPLLPFESPESVIWKFSWFNEIAVFESARIFNLAVKKPDLLSELGLPDNWEKWLFSYSNGGHLGRGVVSDAFGDDDWILFDVSNVRFCPICLGAGYHTWWHQCLLHAVCLIHGCPLVTTCASCDAPVRFNAGPGFSRRRPYLCLRCSQPISGVELTLEAAKDLTSIRPILVSRYAEWACWLKRASILRSGWQRLHKNWYCQVDDERLRRQRARREFEAVLQHCAPPSSAGSVSIPSVRIAEIEVSAEVSYDPAKVVTQFVSEIQETFIEADFEDYRICAENFCGGLRIHAGQINVAPLALWILTAYAVWCREKSLVWVRSAWPKISPEEAWVIELSSPVGSILPDAKGLHFLLTTIYAELIKWLEPRTTRECFDLDFERISLLPGFSVNLIADDGGNIRSAILVRPKISESDLDEFHLWGESQSLRQQWRVPHSSPHLSYAFDCLYAYQRRERERIEIAF